MSLCQFAGECSSRKVLVAGSANDGIDHKIARYESTEAFSAVGGLLLGILPETAMVKFMRAPPVADNVFALKKLMARTIAGELST